MNRRNFLQRLTSAFVAIGAIVTAAKAKATPPPRKKGALNWWEREPTKGGYIMPPYIMPPEMEHFVVKFEQRFLFDPQE